MKNRGKEDAGDWREKADRLLRRRGRGRAYLAMVRQRAAAGEGVIVADNFAQLHGLGLGDEVDIPAPYGMVRLPIVGIIVDFFDQQGTVYMDRTVFLQYWRDDTVSDFRVFVAPGSAIDDVRRRVINLYAGQRHVFVLTNDEGREYILRIAGQWFGLMNVQIAIAVLVAILGIVNTLTVSITDRRRELGVLKAVGALRGQVRVAIWLEAASALRNHSTAVRYLPSCLYEIPRLAMAVTSPSRAARCSSCSASRVRAGVRGGVQSIEARFIIQLVCPASAPRR